ncbi:MAG: hypothetical protein M1826_001380 [Phylliscum demangeonii]|nr:MAG: hypothetical protein M1826_001380 [Phylliscum demangeonii]
MASAHTPDLSLPSHAPTQKYQDEPDHSGLPAAVYSLVELGAEGGAAALNRILETDDPHLHGTCRVAPQFNFVGRPLRDAYLYHVEHVAPSGAYHPTLFLVAHRPDYQQHGVLLVNLDVDLDTRVDTCRVSAQQAASAYVNLAIANMNWDELKNDELPSTLASVSGDPDGAPIDAARAPSHPPPPPSTPPPGKPHFAVYTTAGADMTRLRDHLEPGWHKRGLAMARCDTVCTYEAPPDPWQEMVKMHPWCCCRARGSLHPQLYLCADHKDFETKGLLVVKQEWDGNLNRPAQDLLDLAKSAPARSKRVPTKEALDTIQALADGTRQWEA